MNDKIVQRQCHYCHRFSVLHDDRCRWCGHKTTQLEVIVNRIMKVFLLFGIGFAACVVACDLMAQTGVYYDPMRNGEGITAYDDGERLVFYFYTYGAERCDLVEGVVVSDTACETVEVSATAECPLDRKGAPLCDPVVVTESIEVCATAEAEGIDKECDINGQRWFFGTNTFDGLEATGILYKTVGLDYPKGVPNPEIWEGAYMGELEVAGLYLMQWDGEGWTLAVIPYGDVDTSDPLYQERYTFDTLLFP